MSLDEKVLQDLSQRFLHPLPLQEWQNANRLMLAIQKAHWFYLDYYVPYFVNCSKLNFTDFTFLLANYSCGWTREVVQQRIRDFWQYLGTLPRCGGILVNKSRDRVLLVRNVGGKRWDFPMGKQDDLRQECTKLCAQREVFEETGYWGIPSDDLLTYTNKRRTRVYLYVFYDVPDEYDFRPQTHQEIAEVIWHPVRHLDKKIGCRPFFKQLYQILKKHSSPTLQPSCFTPQHFPRDSWVSCGSPRKLCEEQKKHDVDLVQKEKP